MHYNISFPNLGIYLDHVGKSISIFGFSIAYYGMIIGAAILIGFLIATAEAKRTGQNPEDYLDMGIVGVIAGIAGARIYYVIFSWDLYKDNLLSIFNLREGGLAIYGGVIGAVIAVFVMAAVKKKSPFQILDTIALALLNGQMLGRWGNFFNREAFGEYTDCLFAMRLPVDAVRPGDITELMRENMQRIDGVSYIQVHPTFLYESLGTIIIFVILAVLQDKRKFEGQIAYMYLALYSLLRFFIEGIRADSLMAFNIRISQILSLIIFVLSIGIIVQNIIREKQTSKKDE